MNNKVNTQTKRRKMMENTLERISNNNDNKDLMSTQGSSLLSSLIDDSNEDVKNKLDAMDCANQIYYSVNELRSLNSRYSLTDNGQYAYKWLRIDDINLLDYVPNCVTEIKGNNGENYNPVVKDFYCCFALFKKWIKPTKKVVTETQIVTDENTGKQSTIEVQRVVYDKRGMFLQRNNDFLYTSPLQRKQLEETRSKIESCKNILKEIENKIIYYKNQIDICDNFVGTEMENIKNIITKTMLTIKLTTYINSQKEIKNSITLLENNLKINKTKGSYFEDDYLIQRTIKEIKQEKKEFLTGVKTYEKWHWKKKWGWARYWGKDLVTEEVYEPLVADVTTSERETIQEPEFPLVSDFKNFVIKGSSFDEECLDKDINSLNNINNFKNSGGYLNNPPNWLNFFKGISFNDVYNGKKIYVHDENYTMNYAWSVYKNFPEFLYFGNNEKFFTVKAIAELVKVHPTIKQEYESRYNKAINVVRHFVYDEEDLGEFYKNYKWEVKITLTLDSTNMTYPDDIKFDINKEISDKAFINISKCFSKKIIDDLKRSKKIYEESPKGNRCEDYEPSIKYDEFINYLINLNIDSITQSKKFFIYCNTTIKKWLNNRSISLFNTTTDEDNAKKFLDILMKRLRKNSGSLMRWYQSVLNFDDTYIDNITTEKIIKNDIKYVLVTKAYEGNDNNLFNKQRNPNFIDIEDVSNEYKTNFYVGNTIYIVKDLKEQKNYITRIGKINIKKVNYNTDKIEIKRVTRLYLRFPLLDCFYTDDPSKIMVGKLL